MAFIKALLIGGTGTISSAITRQLAEQGHQVYLLNRGTRNEDMPANVHTLQADIHDEACVTRVIGDLNFDVVADFIAFVPDDVARDYRLFRGRTKQYMFISSASEAHHRWQAGHHSRRRHIFMDAHAQQ